MDGYGYGYGYGHGFARGNGITGGSTGQLFGSGSIGPQRPYPPDHIMAVFCCLRRSVALTTPTGTDKPIPGRKQSTAHWKGLQSATPSKQSTIWLQARENICSSKEKQTHKTARLKTFISTVSL
ncbi:hypothetical protein LY76DRAFT_270895 [Colletotrichum caudatum]|nr:hypothetical protein LY76DRAFT_270895 [Colletotrichum caudatum]